MDLQTILAPGTVEVSQLLARSGCLRPFYLAGGTGLALQLGHRRSDDLDFFTKEPRETIDVRSISKTMEGSFHEGDAVLQLKSATQVTWSIRGTKVSFVAYPFPLLWPLKEAQTIMHALRGVQLASAQEIATMKAYALGRRAVARDYVDLYFAMASGAVTLKDVIDKADKKFILRGEPVFSRRLFLEQLCYTKDLEDVEAALRLVGEPGITLRTVEEFLRKEVERFLRAGGLGGDVS